jgi:FkbM family methyltransferase
VNWHDLNNSDYEPDTIAFLAKYVDKNCIFLDCGAAVGAMSLVAESLGAKVVAYEPMEHIFELAQANVKMNRKLASQIEIKKVAIGNAESSIEIIGKSERNILSEIVSESRNFKDKPIKVLDLKSEIKSINNNKIVLKIDIEGAEFKLLSDNALLSLLKSRKAICILALHPGFTRPVKGNKLRIIRKTVWKVRNTAKCYLV